MKGLYQRMSKHASRLTNHSSTCLLGEYLRWQIQTRSLYALVIIASLTMNSRKKFRKMKRRFDEAMRESNELYILEQKGIQKARQLAIENEYVVP